MGGFFIFPDISCCKGGHCHEENAEAHKLRVDFRFCWVVWWDFLVVLLFLGSIPALAPNTLKTLHLRISHL
jgi:hypothetical protein